MHSYLSMTSYIVNNTPHGTKSKPPITFTQEDVVGTSLRRISGKGYCGEKWFEACVGEYESFINILFRATYDMMLIDHELTPMAFLIYVFTYDNIILRKKIP